MCEGLFNVIFSILSVLHVSKLHVSKSLTICPEAIGNTGCEWLSIMSFCASPDRLMSTWATCVWGYGVLHTHTDTRSIKLLDVVKSRGIAVFSKRGNICSDSICTSLQSFSQWARSAHSLADYEGCTERSHGTHDDDISLPIGSMYAIYGNMDPINIPPMLAYIPAPWILWVINLTFKP